MENITWALDAEMIDVFNQLCVIYRYRLKGIDNIYMFLENYENTCNMYILPVQKRIGNRNRLLNLEATS